MEKGQRLLYTEKQIVYLWEKTVTAQQGTVKENLSVRVGAISGGSGCVFS